MTELKRFRSFVVIDREVGDRIAGFVEAYAQGRSNQLEFAALIHPDLAKLVEDGDIQLAFPSLEAPPREGGKGLPGPEFIADLDRLVLAFETDDRDQLEDLPELIQVLQAPLAADLPFAPADHWCPGGPPDHQFGVRADARTLIRAQALTDAGLLGSGVNVVIVDFGLNAEDVADKLGGTFGGGWDYCPDAAPPCIAAGSLQTIRGVTNDDHGMIVARNVLSIAPQAILHDVPLIPRRITDVHRFLSNAYVVFFRILTDLRNGTVTGAGDPWVVVNAWGIFDRLAEVPSSDYATNPNHYFNALITDLVDHGVDVVFAAGNCGQFCPDQRCGPYDRGPGRSIFGANAHPSVLSVAAVRTDGIWIGGSSQGPGPASMTLHKPDLAAPSMFTETTDRHTRNGGTSASSALAAGVIAALRQGWGPGDVNPGDMKTVLRDSARDAGLPPNASQRFGAGILDAAHAMELLPPHP